MIIGEKDIKEIVVTNKSNELIISITDNDIISKDNYSVDLSKIVASLAYQD